MELIVHLGSKGQTSRVDLKKGDKVHFIGISGVAMAGVAGVLKSKGFHVQGSDQNTYPPMSVQLKNTNILVMEGYLAQRITPQLKLVVVGNSISAQNEEAQALMKCHIPYVSLPEIIRSILISEKQSLVVSGTHGKTTTSAMVAWLAHSCGYHPDFLIGGIPNNFGQSFKNENSSLFVIEGDEYDSAFFDKRPKFIHYQPSCVILTSIEFDHVDIYENINKVKNSFELLIQSLPQDGLLVANGEDKNIQDIIHKAKKVITYGVNQGDYLLTDRKPWTKQGFQEFSVQCPNQKKVFLKLCLYGLHNAMNALAVFALSQQLGWDQKKVLQGLSEFKGVRRRLQVLAEFDQVVLIEDFAHHPTAVRSTISALKERYPGYNIVVVFEPRSASSRRNVFQKQYVLAFSKADQVFVAPPFREFEIKKEERFSSVHLVQDLNVHGVSAEFHSNIHSMVSSIVNQIKNKSVIIVMSNGPFGGIHQVIKKRLSSLFS